MSQVAASKASGRKLRLLGASSIVAVLACFGGYEIFERVRYHRWKANYDNDGWIERLTVASSNPKLIWEYRPSARYTHPLYSIDTNRWGFRDVDYPSPFKSVHVERTAFIGDSVTLGMFVSPEQAFVKQFERQFNRSGSATVEGMNFGVDGYNGMQVLELARSQVVEFSPDRVVYMMHLNDFDFDDASGAKIVYFRPPRSFALLALRRLRHRLSGQGYYHYHYARTHRRLFAEILDVRARLEERGIEFAVAVLPVFLDVPRHFEQYRFQDIHDEILAFLDENDISRVDLLAAFGASGKLPTELSFDVWHPNPEGHRLIAETLLESFSR